jgi:glutathione synthase/RimK-type ligase-like ATP-grasp enzyme
MTRIALATCESHPGFIANDDAPLLEALRERECDAALERWDDTHVDWSAFDAVVLRTTWDYMDRLDDFLAWCARVTEVSTLFNPLPVVEANIRKTYLRDLREAGVPIVPTRWLDPDEPEALAFILEEAGWADTDVILKPSVGAGASGMLRAHAADLDRLIQHAKQELRHGPVMIQPWLGSILDRGELSIVLIDGHVSHAVRKTPKHGEFRVQIEFGGTYTPVTPTPRETEVALAAHAAAVRAHNDNAPLLYARVDLVEPEPDTPVVIELELIEPELFFPNVPEAAPRFAEATLARL